MLDAVQAAATEGTSAEELTQQIQLELGADYEVRTGVEEAEEQSSEIATFTTIIRYFLLSFAGIALVGAFVIFNTLSITVAQTREFATLRTLGASRRQVLRFRDPGGARDRPRRLDHRPLQRARHCPRAERALQVAEPRSPADGHPSSRRARSVSFSCSWARS